VNEVPDEALGVNVQTPAEPTFVRSPPVRPETASSKVRERSTLREVEVAADDVNVDTDGALVSIVMSVAAEIMEELPATSVWMAVI
jgi:hypothetical protein